MLDLTAIPTPATARLRLRGFTGADLDSFAAMLADPEVAVPKGMDRAATRDESWRGLVNVLGHWALRGHGLFAVETLAEGRFVRAVGVIRLEGWPGPELAWTLRREAWGRGYATEAALAARDWALGPLGMDRLISLIAPGHAPSIRVAERLGARHERDGTFFGAPVRVYAMERSR
jgi:RimJ/RimL family protein N-acetyltransferase